MPVRRVRATPRIGRDFVPNAEERLLLRSVLSPEPAALDAWERWRSVTGGVASRGEPSSRLMPLLYRRLSAFGVEDPVMEELKERYRETWTANQRVLYEASHVLGRLAERAVPTIALKGAALIELYYRDVGVRTMADVDILVPAAQARDAFSILEGSGWTEMTGMPYDHLLAVKHGSSFVDDREHQVDLHWNALSLPGDDADFWTGAVPLTVRGAPTLALCPTDQLLHVAVHGTGPFGAPVVWIADAVTVLREADNQMDWDRLVDLGVARGVTLRLASALRFVRETFDIAVPDSAVERLMAARRSAGERLSHWALSNDPKHGGAYLHHWDRWQRLRGCVPPGPMPSNFAQYLAWSWNVQSYAELAGRLGNKAVQIARHGRSDPTGL